MSGCDSIEGGIPTEGEGSDWDNETIPTPVLNPEKIRKAESVRTLCETTFPEPDFLMIAKAEFPDAPEAELRLTVSQSAEQYAKGMAHLMDTLESSQISEESFSTLVRETVSAATLYVPFERVHYYRITESGDYEADSRQCHKGEMIGRALDAAAVELSCMASEQQALDYHVYVKRLMGLVGENPEPYFLGTFTHISGAINATNRSPKQAPASENMYRDSLAAVSGHANISIRLGVAFTHKDLMSINRNAISRATEDRHPERLLAINTALKELESKSESPANLRFALSVIRYARAHHLSDEQAATLSQSLLPALESNDEQVNILQRDGNDWGMSDGDYGIGDFTVESYAATYEPKSLNSLQMVLRDIPTSEMHRFEQNRKDALSLSSHFGSLRDFIHDQRPLVHEVVSAMVTFYENRDPSPLEAVLIRTDYLASGTSHDSILEPSMYDAVVHDSDEVNSMPVIEILKRLKENTEPASEDPPHSGQYVEFMQLMHRALGTGDTKVFGEALDLFTQSLEKKMAVKTEGVGPDCVRAIAWVSRASFRILQAVSYEDQQDLGRQLWFQSLLKLQELIASAQPYDPDKTKLFVESVADAPNPNGMALIVMQRAVERISGLVGMYEKNGQSDWKDALWSGNVDHELMGLVDARRAQTAYGKRHREESSVPISQRNTGD